MTIKGVTFDIGGVLYSDDVFKRAIKKALIEMGAHVTDESFEKVYGDHLEAQNGSLRNKLCNQFLGSLDRKEELLKITDKYWLFETSDIYEDGKKELQKLKNSGLKLGIIANQPATVADSLKRDGLYDLFEFVGISALVGLEKPKPEFFSFAANKLGLSPTEIVHVGNRVDNDVKPAKSIGMKTIWVMRGEANPNPTVSDLREADLSVLNLENISELIATL